MNFLKKIFAPKEIRAALGILDEATYTFDNEAFQLVRNYVEKILLAKPEEFVSVVQNGMPPRQWIYTTIANIAGDLLESGSYHIYRGVLNPLGLGPDLLKLFDAAIDELTKLEALDTKRAEIEKEAIRENMKGAG